MYISMLRNGKDDFKDFRKKTNATYKTSHERQHI